MRTSFVQFGLTILAGINGSASLTLTVNNPNQIVVIAAIERPRRVQDQVSPARGAGKRIKTVVPKTLRHKPKTGPENTGFTNPISACLKHLILTQEKRVKATAMLIDYGY